VADPATNGVANAWPAGRRDRGENTNAFPLKESDADRRPAAAAQGVRAGGPRTLEEYERIRLEGAQRGWRPSDYPLWYFATHIMPDYSPPPGVRAHQIVGRVGGGRRAICISIARSPGWERDPTGDVRWVSEDVVRRTRPAPLELTADEIDSDRRYRLHEREWCEWWLSHRPSLSVEVRAPEPVPTTEVASVETFDEWALRHVRWRSEELTLGTRADFGDHWREGRLEGRWGKWISPVLGKPRKLRGRAAPGIPTPARVSRMSGRRHPSVPVSLAGEPAQAPEGRRESHR
jgi:hypothetical protein